MYKMKEEVKVSKNETEKTVKNFDEINQRQKELLKLILFFQKFSSRRVNLTVLYYKTDYTYRTITKDIVKMNELNLVVIDKLKKKKGKKTKTNEWSLSLTEAGIKILQDSQ